MSMVAMLSVFVNKTANFERVNQVISEYADSIIGRLPLRPAANADNFTVVLDASQENIMSLSSKIRRLDGVKRVSTEYAEERPE